MTVNKSKLKCKVSEKSGLNESDIEQIATVVDRVAVAGFKGEEIVKRNLTYFTNMLRVLVINEDALRNIVDKSQSLYSGTKIQIKEGTK